MNISALVKLKISINLNSLGQVEMRYISINDMEIFSQLIKENSDDKNFVIKVLFNQIKKPQIQYEELYNLPELEIEMLVKTFIQKQSNIFKSYNATGNFYKDFRESFLTGIENETNEFFKSIESVKNSILETLSNFNNDYASIIQQSINCQSYIQESINNVAKTINIEYERANEAVNQAINQYQLIARNLEDVLRPQITLWQNWVEQNKEIFTTYENYWRNFEDNYNITEKKAIPILKKYKWFISPSMPITFTSQIITIGQKKGRQDKKINELFLNYFIHNNWENLELLIKDWKKNQLFNKRIKIVKNCIKILKNTNNKINIVNVVLPSLIAQIDGFLTDYLNHKGIRFDCAYDDLIQNKQIRKVGRKTQFNKHSCQNFPSELNDLTKDIFLNILFQGSQKGKPLKTPFNFNRHKIMHGENTNYGRLDYLIRAFMLIDFLVNLK